MKITAIVSALKLFANIKEVEENEKKKLQVTTETECTRRNGKQVQRPAHFVAQMPLQLNAASI